MLAARNVVTQRASKVLVNNSVQYPGLGNATDGGSDEQIPLVTIRSSQHFDDLLILFSICANILKGEHLTSLCVDANSLRLPLELTLSR